MENQFAYFELQEIAIYFLVGYVIQYENLLVSNYNSTDYRSQNQAHDKLHKLRVFFILKETIMKNQTESNTRASLQDQLRVNSRIKTVSK